MAERRHVQQWPRNVRVHSVPEGPHNWYWWSVDSCLPFHRLHATSWKLWKLWNTVDKNTHLWPKRPSLAHDRDRMWETPPPYQLLMHASKKIWQWSMGNFDFPGWNSESEKVRPGTSYISQHDKIKSMLNSITPAMDTLSKSERSVDERWSTFHDTLKKGANKPTPSIR